MSKLASNNNGRSIRKLARSEMKHSRMRNFFVIVTIVMSVSLLMVVALFYLGIRTEMRRQAANMQHVIYENVDYETAKCLAEEPETEYVLTMKRGMTIEIDRKNVQFTSFDNQPLKSEGREIETAKPYIGELPKAYDEIMLTDEHCDLLGIPKEPGQKVPFTFLDGTTEEFTVSGIVKTQGSQKVLPVYMSEEYGKNGAQLKNLPYSAVVRIHGVEDMDQATFQETIRELGERCGIERKNINENGGFRRTLSGGDINFQENMIILGVCIGVAVVSVLVIYSVFYLAVVGKIRQFGQFRTIGMTRKQIRKMVRMEGLYLCRTGIPIGLLIGAVVSYFIRPGGFSLKNTILTAVCVTAADIVTVLVSVSKPAKIAASVSPVEAAKYSGYENQAKVKSTRKLYRRITPGSLAAMSSSRNKKKTAMTMISLGVGGVLFMLASFFVTSTSLEEYARQGSLTRGEFVFYFSSNVSKMTEHGTVGIQMNNPLNDTLKERIEAIDGVREVLAFEDVSVNWDSHGEKGEPESMSKFTRTDVPVMQEMLEDGSLDYDEFLAEDKVVINYNEWIEEYYGWSYEIGDTVTLNWFDGQQEQKREFQVGAVVNTDEYRDYSNQGTIYILPEDTLREMMNGMNINSEFVVRIDEEKYDTAEAALTQILDETPQLGMRTLKEAEAQAQQMFSLLFSVMLGMSIFIVAFSILNLLNTLITNILTRRQEFAMLQSVGMTTGQLTRMIQLEGIRLMAGNLVITLIFGSLAGLAYVEGMKYFGVKYVHYHFPIWFFLGYAVFTLAVTAVVSAVLIKNFQKQPLVERLRQGA